MSPTKRLDAARVKESVNPAEFYLGELPSMPTPRKRNGLVNGGLCPFHADQRPSSFFVNVSNGAFVCYACGAQGGDVLAFLMLRVGYTFRDALEYLAEYYG